MNSALGQYSSSVVVVVELILVDRAVDFDDEAPPEAEEVGNEEAFVSPIADEERMLPQEL